MTHKSTEAYTIVLNLLTTICKNKELPLKPESIMMEFEKSLRSAIHQIFPSAKKGDCYFHYVKYLWGKASKIGLREESLKTKTRLLIGLLKALVHCPTSKQNDFFES